MHLWFKTLEAEMDRLAQGVAAAEVQRSDEARCGKEEDGLVEATERLGIR